MSGQYPGETLNPLRNSEPYSIGYEAQNAAFTAEQGEYAYRHAPRIGSNRVEVSVHQMMDQSVGCSSGFETDE
jgi:hypothetical protein